MHWTFLWSSYAPECCVVVSLHWTLHREHYKWWQIKRLNPPSLHLVLQVHCWWCLKWGLSMTSRASCVQTLPTVAYNNCSDNIQAWNLETLLKSAQAYSTLSSWAVLLKHYINIFNITLKHACNVHWIYSSCTQCEGHTNCCDLELWRTFCTKESCKDRYKCLWGAVQWWSMAFGFTVYA